MIEKNGTSSRLLTLLSLLQTRRDWPGADLAERLDVTPRTVRRDVDRLRELGYPVRATKGPDGGYRLDAGADLPPLLFDDDQAVALTVALQLALTSGAGIGEAAARALTTVRQVMPARLKHRIDAVRVTPVTGAGVPEVDAGVLVDLTRTIRARETLRMRYDTGGAAGAVGAGRGAEDAGRVEQPRRVEPHHLVARGGRWYLLAWDLDRSAWRTFRVDRLTPRTPTGPRFTPREVPGGDVAAFVESTFRGSGGIARGWPCTGTVELTLPAAEVAPYAGEGLVEALGPDRCRLTLGAWSWVGVAAAVARFDAEVLTVSPEPLVSAFRDLSERFAVAGRAGGQQGAPGTVRDGGQSS